MRTALRVARQQQSGIQRAAASTRTRALATVAPVARGGATRTAGSVLSSARASTVHVAAFSTGASSGASTAGAAGPSAGSSVPPCPQPFSQAEQEQIWEWCRQGSSVDAAQMRQVLAFAVRCISAQAMRSDSLESQALLKILAQYDGWRVPTSIPQSAATPTPGQMIQHTLLTFPLPSASVPSQVMCVYSSHEDIPPSLIADNSTDEQAVSSMRMSGDNVFLTAVALSSAPPPHRAGALSFNNGTTTDPPTFIFMPFDGPTLTFLRAAAHATIVTRVLQGLSRETLIWSLPKWFGPVPPPPAPGTPLADPAERPSAWYTVLSGGPGGGGLISNNFGDTSSPRQNILLFPGRELALQYLRSSGADQAGGRVQTLRPEALAENAEKLNCNVVFISDILTKTGQINMKKITVEELKEAADKAAAEANANASSTTSNPQS